MKENFKPIYLITLIPILFLIVLLSIKEDDSDYMEKKDPTKMIGEETIVFLCDYNSGNFQEKNPYTITIQKGKLNQKTAFLVHKHIWNDRGEPDYKFFVNKWADAHDFRIIWTHDNIETKLNRDSFEIYEAYKTSWWDEKKLDCTEYDPMNAWKIIYDIRDKRKEAHQKKLDERKF